MSKFFKGNRDENESSGAIRHLYWGKIQKTSLRIREIFGIFLGNMGTQTPWGLNLWRRLLIQKGLSGGANMLHWWGYDRSWWGISLPLCMSKNSLAMLIYKSLNSLAPQNKGSFLSPFFCKVLMREPSHKPSKYLPWQLRRILLDRRILNLIHALSLTIMC